MTEQEKMLNERMNRRIHSYTDYRIDRQGNRVPYQRYYFSYNGKKHAYMTEQAAREAYRRLFAGEPEQVRAKNTPSTDITVEQAIKEWFVGYSATVKPDSAARTYRTLKNVIIPSVGSIRILDISSADIQRMCDCAPTTNYAKKRWNIFAVCI